MKLGVANFISKCLACAQFKFEHQASYGQTRSLQISSRKWDKMTVDFIIGLSRTSCGHDSIWVIVD